MAEDEAVDDVEIGMFRAMHDATGKASGDEEDKDLTEFKERSSFDGSAMDKNEIGAESYDDDEDRENKWDRSRNRIVGATISTLTPT